jgi:hypothetical protein
MKGRFTVFGDGGLINDEIRPAGRMILDWLGCRIGEF